MKQRVYLIAALLLLFAMLTAAAPTIRIPDFGIGEPVAYETQVSGTIDVDEDATDGNLKYAAYKWAIIDVSDREIIEESEWEWSNRMDGERTFIFNQQFNRSFNESGIYAYYAVLAETSTKAYIENYSVNWEEYETHLVDSDRYTFVVGDGQFEMFSNARFPKYSIYG